VVDDTFKVEILNHLMVE